MCVETLRAWTEMQVHTPQHETPDRGMMTSEVGGARLGPSSRSLGPKQLCTFFQTSSNMHNKHVRFHRVRDSISAASSVFRQALMTVELCAQASRSFVPSAGRLPTSEHRVLLRLGDGKGTTTPVALLRLPGRL